MHYPSIASALATNLAGDVVVTAPTLENPVADRIVYAPLSAEHVSRTRPALDDRKERNAQSEPVHIADGRAEQRDEEEESHAADLQLENVVQLVNSSSASADADGGHSVQRNMDADADQTDSRSDDAGAEVRTDVNPVSLVGKADAVASEDDAVTAKEKDQQRGDDSAVEKSPVLSGRPFRDPANFSTFNEDTALNYFHLHKTGGVSFKERLFDFFNSHEKLNRRGYKAKVVDTCHVSANARPAQGTEAQWSCDWGELEVMPEKQRNKIDVIVGHQYWEEGANYWLPNRDLRCFTIMRHPLHRKISFFYHFFVRNAGRSEQSVSKNELIQFVLGNNMPDSPLVRDAGPNYYASRLWSDGLLGYNENHTFIVRDEAARDTVSDSIRRLRKNFVFIGLQTQEKASLCMLKKTVYEFARAHGFNNMDGLDDFDTQRERLNIGSYPLTGKLLWEQMNKEQREEFKRVERVDLAIFRESVKMFHEMVKRFDCEHLVVDDDEDNIAM